MVERLGNETPLVVAEDARAVEDGERVGGDGAEDPLVDVLARIGTRRRHHLDFRDFRAACRRDGQELQVERGGLRERAFERVVQHLAAVKPRPRLGVGNGKREEEADEEEVEAIEEQATPLRADDDVRFRFVETGEEVVKPPFQRGDVAVDHVDERLLGRRERGGERLDRNAAPAHDLDMTPLERHDALLPRRARTTRTRPTAIKAKEIVCPIENEKTCARSSPRRNSNPKRMRP